MRILRNGTSILSLIAALLFSSSGLQAQATEQDLTRENFRDAPRGGLLPKRRSLQPSFNPPALYPPDLVSAPFRVLDTVVGPFVNLNNVPFSPFALAQSLPLMAVVNPSANIVRLFNVSDPNPANWTLAHAFKTAWGPTSCAFWENPSCLSELLVTCSNSDSLIWFAAGGRVHGLLSLPGEPSDLLVDHARSVAWISCMAADVVVEIDLIEKKFIRQYPIPSKHPAYLSFENGVAGRVLVAPMQSGNNTTVDRGPAIFLPGPDGILDLSTAPKGLPDEDLFRLDPVGGTVEPVVTRAGTILFDHLRNPNTGHHWMLGTDAKNFQFQSEPDAKGIFSENRLSIVSGLPASGPPVPPTTIINLDDSNRTLPGVQYDITKTVGQPNALTFDAQGNGYITGMLTDNVTMLDSAGNWVQEWNVGSIPRGLQVIPNNGNEFLAVFCWGTNTVEIYQPALGTGLVATLRLGADPLPQPIVDGRKVFYDASHSQFNNHSCATCHVDGFSDLVAWDLSDLRKDVTGNHTIPIDPKGPLVTQTLRTIRGQLPFHWRGERATLDDFNPAFEGLLGGTMLDETPGGELSDFKAFVFSLHERANPHESRRRVVSDKIIPASYPKSTSAVRGQDIFFDIPALPGNSCQNCHQLPSGTNNDVFRDEPNAPEVTNSHFAVSPLMSFWRKLQTTRVQVQHANDEMETMPVLGVGLSATGLADDVQDFVIQGGFNLLNAQAKHDVAAYLQQIDTGIPPLMHLGVRIGYGSTCNTPAPVSTPPVSGNPRNGATTPGVTANGGTLTGGGLSTPAGSSSLPKVAAVAPPGTSIADVEELENNVDEILLLTNHASIDEYDVVVVGELNGLPVAGTYDTDDASFDLSDGIAPVNISKNDLLDALVDEDLVGMMFATPLGQAIVFEEYDPFGTGPPYVIPGPGPVVPVDPDDGTLGDEEPLLAAPGRPGVDPSSGLDPTMGAELELPRDANGLPMFAMGGGPMISDFEVVYATTRVAKIIFFTDSPARSDTEYTPQGGAPRMQSEPMMRSAHMVFLRDLIPSESWDLRIVVTNTSGSSELLVPSAFQSKDRLQPNHVRVTQLSTQAPLINSGGVLHFRTDFVVRRLDGMAAVNYTPIVDVFVYDATNDYWRLDQAEVQGPLTDNVGQSTLDLIVGGLGVNDIVFVKITNLMAPDTTDYRWSFPDTPARNRTIEVTYTGTGP